MGSENKSGERGEGRGTEAVLGMPAATKKVVQSLKEIVNCSGCTDQEIYAVLEECDMDPDRAVERLLAQDTFQEVKSKRERRKEIKEALDSRPRRCNVGLSRGGKTCSERNVVLSGAKYVTYNELGKATDKREVGSACTSVTSSMTRVTGKNMDSDSFSTDNRRQSLGTGDSILASAGVSPGLKPNFLGVSKGHLSMADIVRMGKPSQDSVLHCHSKTSGVSAFAKTESSLSLHYYNHSGQQDFDHEWPLTEEPMAGNESHASMLSAPSNAKLPSDHFNVQSTTVSLLRNSVSDGAQVSQGDVASDNVNSDKIESGILSSRHTIVNNAGLVSHSNCNLKKTSATDSHSYCEHHEDVSSAASDFQQLSFRDSKLEVLSTGGSCAVVLPNHVQDLTAKCSHLSFGRYNCGSNSTSSAMLASQLSRSGLEEKAAVVDGGSLAQYLDSSSSVNCGDKLLGLDFFKETAIERNYDFLSSCQPELMKRTLPGATLGHEYTIMSSVPDPSFEKSQWVTPPLPFKRPDLQNGTMSTFSSEMVMKPHSALPHRSSLPQDLAALHLEQLADNRGYRPLPQNHQYMASMNSQQAFSGSSAYNHSLADMRYSHPQNRNEFFMSRLPPARDAFGYGNSGSSSYNPGNFLSNSSLGPMMPSSNFDEILPSQYNGGRNLSSVQQRGSFSAWDYGDELRSLSLPDNTRHSSLGQPLQAQSQHMSPGYSDLYLETRILAELQRQGGSQDLSSKQSHQFGSTATNSLLSAHTMSRFFH